MTDMFKIKTPKAQTIVNGSLGATLQWKPEFGSKMSGKFQEAQNYIDHECLQYCEYFIPKDTGALIQSGTIHTQIGSGEVIYRTVYARRWYYRPASFQEAPIRGNYWFHRMKRSYKKRILTGAGKILSGG